MKPCSHNRKPIAWLAAGALDKGQEHALRAHLETCDGCRGYLHEVSFVTQQLAATKSESDIQASGSFHQKVVSRLRAEESLPVWESVMMQLRAAFASWRIAGPLIGAAAVVAFSLFVWRPATPPSTGGPSAALPSARNDIDPTISNYQFVANRSMEKLDELLTRQGNRNPTPTPIYTASALARADILE